MQLPSAACQPGALEHLAGHIEDIAFHSSASMVGHIFTPRLASVSDQIACCLVAKGSLVRLMSVTDQKLASLPVRDQRQESALVVRGPTTEAYACTARCMALPSGVSRASTHHSSTGGRCLYVVLLRHIDHTSDARAKLQDVPQVVVADACSVRSLDT